MIKNIPFYQYWELPEKERERYDYVIKYSVKLKTNVDIFGFGDLTGCSFKFVKDLQSEFEDGVSWESFLKLITEETGETMQDIAKNGIFDLCMGINHIRQSVIEINVMESENLGHASTTNEEAAGIDRFNKYGSFLQYDSLTGGDITKIKQVEKIKYSICYAKLLLEKDRNEFQEAFNKLR